MTVGEDQRRGGKTRTYRTQGNGSSGQADQPTVAGMGLVDSVGIVVAQLVENGLNFGVILFGNYLANDALKTV